MSKLVTYFTDEKRIHLESTYGKENELKLFVESSYGSDELVGTFAEVKGKLTLILEKDQKVVDIKVATEQAYKDVTTITTASNEVPF